MDQKHELTVWTRQGCRRSSDVLRLLDRLQVAYRNRRADTPQGSLAAAALLVRAGASRVPVFAVAGTVTSDVRTALRAICPDEVAGDLEEVLRHLLPAPRAKRRVTACALTEGNVP